MFKEKQPNAECKRICHAVRHLYFRFAIRSSLRRTRLSDTMVINAPPAEVWKYVVAYKRIETPGKYWLFRIGMPSPVQSTAEGYYLGAKA
jgi:hypothetical protein